MSALYVVGIEKMSVNVFMARSQRTLTCTTPITIIV